MVRKPRHPRYELGMRTLVVVVLALSTPAVAGDWEEVQDSDGVKVYRRQLPERSLKSVKGTGIVDASVATVALVLLDDARAPEWVDSLTEARVVRMISPSEYIEYNHVAMPLVVSDREFVTRVDMKIDRDKRTVVIRSVPVADAAVKANTKVVRGELSAVYVLESIDAGKRTRLSVEIDADPKGSLPAWIVNFFQKDWSRDTIRGIRMQTQKSDLKVPSEFVEFVALLNF